MKTTSSALITDLVTRTQDNLTQARHLKDEATEALNWKANPTVWSVLECVDHLNQYDKIYLPNIKTSMENSALAPKQHFKSGLFGGWFANLMRPGGAGKKMKTFKSKNPNGKQLNKEVLDLFIKDQQQLLALLETAQQHNLKQVKVNTAAGSWLRINLGDAFRVIVYHNQRHLEQAQRSLVNFATQVRAQGV